MENYKEKLNLLLQLQEKDAVLDTLKNRAGEIPDRIEELKSKISESRSSYDETKKEVTQLQVLKKQKELELEVQENLIKKHSTELNAVKSNDAYKALLSEIEHCRKTKISLENDILDIMEKIEAESKEIKDKEKHLKDDESVIIAEISQLENELTKLNAEIAKIQADRLEFVKLLSDDIMHKYNYIRRSRPGKAIVAIDGEMCSGCNMSVRPAVINEIIKEQDFILCDSCSRILYKK